MSFKSPSPRLHRCGVGRAMRSDDAFDVESQAAGVLPPIDVPAPLALRRTVIGFREGGARRMGAG